MPDSRRSRSRIVVDTQQRYQRSPSRLSRRRTNAEVWAAVSIILAAGLATFVALFLTSRPYDPMDGSVAPQQVVPAGPSLTPSPKSSATATPASSIQSPTPITPSLGGGETSTLPDDAAIQSNIEKALASDPVLSALDVSTLVESGKVTVVGSVKSAELKQRVERAIRSVKGVFAIDDQLVITEATPL